jgi:hydrogenase maturation protease
MKPARIAVFGIGNILLGDDGAGSAVVSFLQSAYDFPDDVELEDLGTPGLELLAHVAGREIVIFVDAVAEDLAPGTVRLYDRQTIVDASPALRVGPHDPALGDTLLALEFAGEGPREAMLVGVVAATTASGIGLTSEVRDAVPVAAQRVIDELSKFGITARRKKGEAMKKTKFLFPMLLALALPLTAFADGAAIYKSKCAMCHGPDGSGNTPMGKNLKLKDLGSPEIQKLTDAEITKTLTDGKGKMPASKLAPADIADVIKFIRTLKK